VVKEFHAYKPANESSAPKKFEYAGLWPRLTAALVDTTIFMIIYLPFMTHFGMFNADMSKSSSISFMLMPISILVWAALESSPMMGTPGKWILGVQVVNQYGQRISFLQALGRHVIKTISMGIPLVNFLVMIVNLVLISKPEKRLLHDHGASTFVIHGKENNPLKTLFVFLGASIIICTIFFKAMLPVMKDQIQKVAQERGNVNPQGKSTGVESVPVFEFVDELIYKEAFDRAADFKKFITTGPKSQYLYTNGTVFCVLENLGSNQYEIQTYMPQVPNLIMNPRAFKLMITHAAAADGTKLTTNVQEDAVSIEQRDSGSQKYFFVKKTFTVVENHPIVKIDGQISLMLPLNLKSEIVRIDRPVTTLKVGTQNFEIKQLTDKNIEFTHDGFPEYFLGMVAYNDASDKQIMGAMKVSKDSTSKVVYQYTFDRSVTKYDFNVATNFYSPDFTFSTDSSN
jgi:uncharacterized RDD family membrane protein YckC